MTSKNSSIYLFIPGVLHNEVETLDFISLFTELIYIGINSKFQRGYPETIIKKD